MPTRCSWRLLAPDKRPVLGDRPSRAAAAHIAIATLWVVARHATQRSRVAHLDGMVLAVAEVGAHPDMPTATRILATNFLFELCGESVDEDSTGTGAEPDDAEMAWRKQFAEEIVAQFQGFSGKYPKLALVVRFLDSDDPRAHKFGAEMLARTAVTQRQKAAVAKLKGPKRLCRLLRSADQEDVVRSMAGSRHTTSLVLTCASGAQVRACLHAMLNLTTQEDCQAQSGRWGVDALLAFTRSVAFPKVQQLATKVLQNVQKHGANRTRLYNTELRLRAQDCLNDPKVIRATRVDNPRPSCNGV